MKSSFFIQMLCFSLIIATNILKKFQIQSKQVIRTSKFKQNHFFTLYYKKVGCPVTGQPTSYNFLQILFYLIIPNSLKHFVSFSTA